MTAPAAPASHLVWSEPTDHAVADAYLDWFATLRARAPGAVLTPDETVAPIFVRLHDPACRAALLAELDRAGSTLKMDAHERAFLEARQSPGDPFAGMDECYALYRSGPATPAHEALFDVIDTGVPVRLAPGAAPQTPRAVPPSQKPGAPIVAVIDDAIGFLNQRFCKQGKTRLHALWLQGLERGTGAAGGVAAGSVLLQDDINALLAEMDEETGYARAYRDHLSAEAVSGLMRSVWHGTHVMDLAGGAGPGDEAMDWPLLAVQLPPEAIEDTSGMRLESYLVQGLRWILRSAFQVDRTAPVIVNLSLGILAGPKDGSHFVEWCVRREAQQWQAATGQTVRIVWAYGNAYRAAQVAGMRFDAASGRRDGERALTWRLQPEDHSPNFCELRGVGIESGQIEVSLTAPDGTRSGFAAMAPGQVRSLTRHGDVIARIFHVKERGLEAGVISPAHYVLATCGTEAHALDAPRAEPGAWRIELRYSGDAAADVILQIQRDEALRGTRGQARPSYFDDAGAYAWDEVWQDYSGLSPDGPICHEGTFSAYASHASAQVLTVGAARWDRRMPGVSDRNIKPSDYTSQGAPWSLSQGPSVSALVDGGPFQSGLPGAGRLSGAVRFANGTSAAAAQVTRALALSMAGGASKPGLAGPGIRLLPVAPEYASRLGPHAVDLSG